LKNINILITELNNKENEFKIYETKQEIGLNIDNFVTTFNYNNNIMKKKISMFITYVEFFHKLHIKYLTRFNNKIHLIYTDINNDIKFDESIEINNKFEADSYTNFSKKNNDKTIKSSESFLISSIDNISLKNDTSKKNITYDNVSNNSNDNVDGLFLNLEASFKSIKNKENEGIELFESIHNKLIIETDEEVKYIKPLNVDVEIPSIIDNFIEDNV